MPSFIKLTDSEKDVHLVNVAAIRTIYPIGTGGEDDPIGCAVCFVDSTRMDVKESPEEIEVLLLGSGIAVYPRAL